MAIQSYGYTGKLSDVMWARSQRMLCLGAHVVAGPDDWRVQVKAGVTRGLTFKAGRGMGDGVYDEVDADVDLVAPAPTSGGNLWSAVVMRRVWGSRTSTPTVVPGGTALAVPALNTTLGTTSDQLVALVNVIGTSSTVSQILDYRCWQPTPLTQLFQRATSANFVSLGTAVEGTLDAPAGSYLVDGWCTINSQDAGVSSNGSVILRTVSQGVNDDSVSLDGTVFPGINLPYSLSRGLRHPGGSLNVALRVAVTNPINAQVRDAGLRLTWLRPST